VKGTAHKSPKSDLPLQVLVRGGSPRESRTTIMSYPKIRRYAAFVGRGAHAIREDRDDLGIFQRVGVEKKKECSGPEGRTHPVKGAAHLQLESLKTRAEVVGTSQGVPGKLAAG